MKRSFTIVAAAILLCATMSHAQSGEPEHRNTASSIYLRIGGGYAFPHAGSTELNGASISGDDALNGNTQVMDVARASFGSGVIANLAGGYMITRHVGIELGVHAVLAPSKYTFNGLVPNFNNRPYTREAHSSLPVYLIPALVLSTGDKLQLYGRAGIVLPLSDKLTIEETRFAAGPGQTEQASTRELTHRFSIGLQGAAGLSYMLGTHLSGWVEVNAISRNAYAKRAEMTAYTEDGIDALSIYTTNERVTEYDFNFESSIPPAASEPSRQPAFSVPFGSIGMCIGVKYNF